MSPEISAIVVNFNGGAELRRGLQSIAAELVGHDWEVVVVDNASTDGSAEIATEFKPHVTLLRNAANVGFGRGVNQGLKASTAPFVLVMNPDCRLMGGALATLRAELEKHDLCAVVGPRILDPDGSVQGSARGDPDMLTGLFGRRGMLRRLMPGLEISRRNVVSDDAVRDTPSSTVVDWVSGACILARRAPLHGAGGFDERYFLYWEDADLCRRLRTTGYEIRYVPAASAVHSVGHSSRAVRATAIRAFHASAYLYYATHVAQGAFNPKRLLARAILTARCLWMLANSKLQDLFNQPSDVLSNR